MAKKKYLYKRVRVKCQWVDSDGTPVNQNGEAYGRGWKKCWSWEWRRQRMARARNPEHHSCSQETTRIRTRGCE